MITIDIRETNTWGKDLGAFISFPFNTDLIFAIKSQAQNKWHPDTKEWEVPLNTIEKLLPDFSNHEVAIKVADASLLADKANEHKISFNFKTTPYQHQIDGFEYGLSHNRWLLGDEQGLGKTKQVIDIAVARKQQRGYKHCLIVCGVNGLKWNWVEEIKTHSNELAYIIGQRATRDGSIKIGSTQDKLKDLLVIAEDDNDIQPYFIITNIESLRDEQIVDAVVSLCNSGKIGMIAADEVHRMKNPQSQQGKGFLKIQADTMIAMTGTPLMNSPLDLYIILKWLGYENHSFYTFKNHYCSMGGFGNHQIVGYKNLESLQSQLNGFMLRRFKDEVLDLPEKTRINEYVEMTAKQAQIYKEVYNSIMANIDMVKMANNPLAEMIRLRQATGYTGILSSTIQESAKLDRMEELVDDARANGKKVVIFSNWKQMTDAIYDRLYSKGYGVSCITGETKDEDRQTIVNLFQESKNCNVLIGTIGAMGTGITLTAGTVEIFMDEPWNRANKEQAEDRCHRIGQTKNLTIYTLLTKGTIDERIHELIEKKGAMADMLVDGKVVGNKGELVDYLLS